MVCAMSKATFVLASRATFVLAFGRRSRGAIGHSRSGEQAHDPYSTLRTGRARRLFLAAIAALTTLVANLPVYAQSSSAHARVLFREARALMDKGRFEEACPKLEESLRLDQGMGTQFNLAHCWEQMGRTASAWGLFLDVASAASASGQSKREAAARQRATALEPKLSRLRIDVPNPVPELKVMHAGEVVGQAGWGTAMPVDPGTHQVEASAPGKKTWSSEVVVFVAGGTESITIPELEDDKPAPAPEKQVPDARPEPIPEQDTGGMSTGRIVSSTLLAVLGAGGVAVGTVYGLKANSETESARALCVGGPSGNTCERDRNLQNFDGGRAERDERNRHVENSDRAALFAYVGWGVAAAGFVTSAVVLLTAPSGGDEVDAVADESAALLLEPMLGSGFIGTKVRGTF
jgi:hypothetical protein